jgi:hypothetical protein
MSRVTGLGWLAAVLLTALPAYAHEVEISNDVGATLHIEPDDKPKAGNPTEIWFALTAKGGQVIPLSECNCNLKIYSDPSQAGATPLLEPPLKQKAVEQYQNIPSAEVIFPKIGAYKLELSGSPKSKAKFSAFSLSYKVVVASKAEPNTETITKPESQPTAEVENESKHTKRTDTVVTNETETEEQPPAKNIWWMVPSGIVLVAGVVGAAIWLIRSNSD